MTYLTLPFVPMFRPSTYCVSKYTRRPESGLKSTEATALSTASEPTSCSVASRDLLMPQPPVQKIFIATAQHGMNQAHRGNHRTELCPVSCCPISGCLMGRNPTSCVHCHHLERCRGVYRGLLCDPTRLFDVG